MNFEILSTTDTSITFDLKNVDRKTANQLRRILISEIPIIGPDKVQIYQNSSYFPDEVLAERIGKIPILNKTVKGLPSFGLNIYSDQRTLILTDNFELLEGEGELMSNLLFLKLDANQEIELTFTTKKANVEQSKNENFSPVTKVSYLQLAKTNQEILTEKEIREKEITEFNLINTFRFKVKTTGILPPLEIIQEGIKLLENS